MTTSPNDLRTPQPETPLKKSLMSPISSNSPNSHQRALSAPHLLSPKPLRTAFNNARRALNVSRRSVSGGINETRIGDENTYTNTASRGDTGFHSPQRNHERSPFGLIHSFSLNSERSISQTLATILPIESCGPKPVRPDRSTIEVDEDLITQPPLPISSARFSRQSRPRVTSTVLEPALSTAEDNTDDLKTPTPASCVQFAPRAPLPQFTPRFIFEEFERVYRVEDELLRAQLAEEDPPIEEPEATDESAWVDEPAPVPAIPKSKQKSGASFGVDADRERFLREDSLLSPGLTRPSPEPNNAGLALAFPTQLSKGVFRPDDVNYRTEPSPYLHQRFDMRDKNSPDRLQSSSRMMKLFDEYLEKTPKTIPARSTPQATRPSPKPSLRRLRSRYQIEAEKFFKSTTTVVPIELWPRTPGFGTRRNPASTSLHTTPTSVRDEPSPDSDDGVGESPQTPFAGGLPAVRVGLQADNETHSARPRMKLESQLDHLIAREPMASYDSTPPARPRTPETERRSPFRLSALGTAASRLAHLRDHTTLGTSKSRRPSEAGGWKHWPSVAAFREPREPVGRVLFEEESRSHGFVTLKQLIGLRRGSSRGSETQLVAGPLLEDWSAPTDTTSSVPMAPPVPALSPEEDLVSPRRAYGKRQGVWETGHWALGDLNLRPPEPTTEEVAEAAKQKQLSKSRILRRAARASAAAARSAATGLGIRT